MILTTELLIFIILINLAIGVVAGYYLRKSKEVHYEIQEVKAKVIQPKPMRIQDVDIAALKRLQDEVSIKFENKFLKESSDARK